MAITDRSKAPTLLRTPLRSLAIEEFGVDPAVELVDIHGVDAVLQQVVLGLEPMDSLLVVAFLVIMAGS